MRFYSIIIPVFNRPQEIDELLSSLASQSYKNFEVLIIDDGSTRKSESIVEKFITSLDLHYYFKENSGQGFSRNFGFEKSHGDYLIVFDSDCIIPPDYLEKVDKHLQENFLDAYGGPDKADPAFTFTQKAINFTMTSFLTTGGIRGSKSGIGKFNPRSFNMGISREVFEKTGGYIITRKGEDIEFSLRITKSGFRVGLIPEAFVYHKRRTNFSQFFRQTNFFGTARINVWRYHPESLKLTHFFPAVFFTGIVVCLVLILFFPFYGRILTALYGIYLGLIFIMSTIVNRNPAIGLLSIFAALVQLTGYGTGFITEGIRQIFSRRKK